MTHDPSNGEVHVERHGRHIAVLTLDQPPSNALTWSGRAQLRSAIAELDADEDVRCTVLTGSGRNFTAGADLREDHAMATDELTAFTEDFGSLLLAIEHARAPVVAAINGAAIGGGLELALACDLRVASEEAVFVAAGVNVGLIANFWRLPRVVGLGPAKEMLLTGERYDAAAALRWGLVTGLHSPDQLLPAALAKAERIASRAPLSVEATKSNVNDALDLDYDTARSRQVEAFGRLFRSDDHAEALVAFFDRRTADFRRR